MRPVDPRLLRHARSARWGVAVLAAAGLAEAVAAVAAVVVLAGAVTALVEDGAVPGREIAWLTTLLALRAVLAAAGQVLAARVGTRVVADLRDAVLAAVLGHGPVWVARFGAHRLAVLAGPGLEALRPWFAGYLPSLVTAAVLPALVVAVVAATDPLSALVVVLTLPLVPLFAVLVGLATRRRAAQRHAADTRLAAHFLDAVRGLATLRLHGRAQRQVAEVARRTDAHRVATTRLLRLAFLSSTALDLVGTLSVGVVAVEAGLRVAAGDLALGPALLVILLAPEAYRPLREVGARYHAAADAGAVVEDVDAVLGGTPAPAPSGATPGATPWVEVRGLRVRHPGRGADALDLPALDVRAGELVALRGPSGAGKTTALRVLAGTQPAGSGRVRVGGRVLLLPQAPALPHARTVADVAGDEARAVVGLDLPPGTPLGDGGAGLSSGQRQRLALARVLEEAAEGPAVVLLDEPTAHLDPAAQRRVVAALRALAAAGCAVLAVAHRDGLLDAADRVVDVVPPAFRPARPGSGPASRPARAVPREAPGPAAPERTAAAPARGGRAVPVAVPVLLGAAASLAGLVLTGAATWLLVRATAMPPVLTLSTAVVLVRGAAVARPLLRWLERLAAHEVAFRRLAALRSAVYAGLVPRVPGPVTAADRRGALLTRVGADVDAQVDGLLRGRLPAAAAVPAVGTAALALALVAPPAALAGLAGALVAGVLAPAAAVLADRRARGRTGPARERLTDAVTETVEALDDLAARPRAAALAVPRERAAVLARADRGAARSAGAGLGLAHAGVGAALVGVLLALPASAAGPQAAAVAALGVTALADVLLGLPDAALARSRARAAAARLTALAQAPVPEGTPVRRGAAGSGLAVRGVVAGWDARPVLRGLDLDVPAGRCVAVTGASGSGKSTLAAVVAGLLPARDGDVAVGGRAGLVGSAAGHVFASTVRENLRLAAPDADDDALRAALAAARLDGWLAGLPDGLDTWLGEGGGTLSGGEHRRLLLARALLADPDVLVLDEPTEGLDPATAELLVADLLDAAAGRAVLLLTHRREGLDRADAVLDLSAGRLAPSRTAAAV